MLTSYRHCGNHHYSIVSTIYLTYTLVVVETECTTIIFYNRHVIRHIKGGT